MEIQDWPLFFHQVFELRNDWNFQKFSLQKFVAKFPEWVQGKNRRKPSCEVFMFGLRHCLKAFPVHQSIDNHLPLLVLTFISPIVCLVNPYLLSRIPGSIIDHPLHLFPDTNNLYQFVSICLYLYILIYIYINITYIYIYVSNPFHILITIQWPSFRTL